MSDTSSADWLRTEMDDLRLNQKEVAGVIGIDPSGISRLLSGRRGLSMEEAQRLRHYFASLRKRREDPKGRKAGNTLEAAMETAGQNLRSLALASGLPEKRIQYYLDTWGHEVPEQDAVALGKALGIDADAINGRWPDDTGVPVRRRSTPRSIDQPVLSRKGLNVPVYAAPELRDGVLVCAFDVVGMREAPPELNGATRAFGLYIGEGDFGGRLRSGDIAWIIAGRPVRPGDDALAIVGQEVRIGTVETIGSEARSIRSGSKVHEVPRHAELLAVVGATFG